jgi:hypothetical protein
MRSFYETPHGNGSAAGTLTFKYQPNRNLNNMNRQQTQSEQKIHEKHIYCNE